MMKFLFQVTLGASALRLRAKGNGLEQLKACRTQENEMEFYQLTPKDLLELRPQPLKNALHRPVESKRPKDHNAYTYYYHFKFNDEKDKRGYNYHYRSRVTHTRLAVCGEQAGSSVDPVESGMILVARSSSVEAEVCVFCFHHIALQ